VTQFQGQIVAITGAGSGIGRAIAINLASRGAQLALSDYNEAALAETTALLPQGTRVECTVLDVSSREQVFAYAEKVIGDFGRAD